ncbi:MAG: ribonuclease HII [Infirmifilum sp.]
MSYIAGIDEAGRGPLIGPMVIAIVAAKEQKLHLIEKLGVRDSKLLTPSRRERLRRVLEETLDYISMRVVSPEEIDRAVEGVTYENLNHLELSLIADLIKKAVREVEIVRVYVDSPDPIPSRFRDKLALEVDGDVEVIVENHADEKYVIVSAASIVAKTERDRIIEKLKREYGDFGSGYPSDPRTIAFIRSLLEGGRDLPPIVRRSWKTLNRIKI